MFLGLEAASYLTTPLMFSRCLDTAYGLAQGLVASARIHSEVLQKN